MSENNEILKERGIQNRGLEPPEFLQVGPGASSGFISAGKTRDEQVQRFIFSEVKIPFWEAKRDSFVRAGHNYYRHLLAIQCLAEAKGRGADPIKAAKFVRKWKWLLTFPLIGPVAMLRKLGNVFDMQKIPFREIFRNNLSKYSLVPARKFEYVWFRKGLSIMLVFDITQSISIGIKIIAEMPKLLENTLFHNAFMVLFNSKVVPPEDADSVGAILQNANRSIEKIHSMLSDSLREYETALKEFESSTVELMAEFYSSS